MNNEIYSFTLTHPFVMALQGKKCAYTELDHIQALFALYAALFYFGGSRSSVYIFVYYNLTIELSQLRERVVFMAYRVLYRYLFLFRQFVFATIFAMMAVIAHI